jgi:hypothetical protein
MRLNGPISLLEKLEQATVLLDMLCRLAQQQLQTVYFTMGPEVPSLQPEVRGWPESE